MTEFEAVVREHKARYPLMQPQDYGKLAYQSEFGPEHIRSDERRAAGLILREWQAVKDGSVPLNPEPIGNGLCRFHLIAGEFSQERAGALAKLFAQSARAHTGSREGLEARIAVLARLPVDGMDAWLAEWRTNGFPPVHHSDIFRA
ncbi:MAG: hypothetical protein IH607_01200, partial [Firmicutes bacterium]|nr:hypothetical protein [Bacillota bacterium]